MRLGRVSREMRYVDPGVTDQIELLPSQRLRKDLMCDSPRYGTVMTDTLLMTSRDGLNSKRWDEAFLRPGIQRQGSWIHGDNSLAGCTGHRWYPASRRIVRWGSTPGSGSWAVACPSK